MQTYEPIRGMIICTSGGEYIKTADAQAEIEIRDALIRQQKAHLSGLTAALNDDEAVEEILEKYAYRGDIIKNIRRKAIIDYRAKIKRKVGI